MASSSHLRNHNRPAVRLTPDVRYDRRTQECTMMTEQLQTNRGQHVLQDGPPSTSPIVLESGQEARNNNAMENTKRTTRAPVTTIRDSRARLLQTLQQNDAELAVRFGNQGCVLIANSPTLRNMPGEQQIDSATPRPGWAPPPFRPLMTRDP